MTNPFKTKANFLPNGEIEFNMVNTGDIFFCVAVKSEDLEDFTNGIMAANIFHDLSLSIPAIREFRQGNVFDFAFNWEPNEPRFNQKEMNNIISILAIWSKTEFVSVIFRNHDEFQWNEIEVKAEK